MEIGNNNLIRLSNGPNEKIKVLVLCKFRYEGRANKGEETDDLDAYIGEEFICVRRVNETETIAYGNYFFMHLVEGVDGQSGCKRVCDIRLAEALMSEMICIMPMAEIIEKKRQHNNKFNCSRSDII